jgi:hypothetical protein
MVFLLGVLAMPITVDRGYDMGRGNVPQRVRTPTLLERTFDDRRCGEICQRRIRLGTRSP